MDAKLAAAKADFLRHRSIGRLVRFVILLLFLTAGFWTLDYLRIPISRVLGMFGRIGRMVSERLMPPDLDFATADLVLYAILETIEMSLLGTFFGILIAIPVAWCAAWNVTPNRQILYPLGRAVLVFARAVPPIIWAMILVVILGFGPIAGTVALILLTVGFAGKLMAEQVEAIDMGPVDAIRATGAGEIKIFVYAILPQVRAPWTGIAIYNWDSVFRASTILGFVGAGGLGLYIRMTTQVLEYQQTMGIITLIIGLVILSELASHYLRHRLR